MEVSDNLSYLPVEALATVEMVPTIDKVIEAVKTNPQTIATILTFIMTPRIF